MSERDVALIMGALEAVAAQRGWRFRAPTSVNAVRALGAVLPRRQVEGWAARTEEGMSLHELLRFCGGLGWRFEPIVTPLFLEIFDDVVLRHGGDAGWVGLAVTLAEDRQSIEALRWVGNGEMLDPPRRVPVPGPAMAASDWMLLFTAPSAQAA